MTGWSCYNNSFFPQMYHKMKFPFISFSFLDQSKKKEIAVVGKYNEWEVKKIQKYIQRDTSRTLGLAYQSICLPHSSVTNSKVTNCHCFCCFKTDTYISMSPSVQTVLCHLLIIQELGMAVQQKQINNPESDGYVAQGELMGSDLQQCLFTLTLLNGGNMHSGTVGKLIEPEFLSWSSLCGFLMFSWMPSIVFNFLILSPKKRLFGYSTLLLGVNESVWVYEWVC